MKLQNLTVIFIIIIIPIILLLSFYISTGIKTIKYQSLYDTGLLTATHDAIYAFELNTTNDVYSDNAETKRNILKASIKALEKSLCNTCGISSYNTDEIEQYIPAIVFGLYDGFYMYAPSYLEKTGKYTHNLKNYVYYSETLKNIGYNNSNVVIIYSLDNYVTVSGNFGDDEDGDGDRDGYKIKSGYLIDLNDSTDTGMQYKSIAIDSSDTDSINYYKDAYAFTEWFNTYIGDKIKDSFNIKFLKIDENNDPEDENSAFVQHKRQVIKQKLENVLNSSITAYSKRSFSNVYKMPVLSEEDWQKIYSNISMITFFQGKNIGLTKYNGYCVLNSTNNNEYINPNLMYFIKDGYYHDIRCTAINSITTPISGYKIGDFSKRKVEQTESDGSTKVDANGNVLYEYKYNHDELACYSCINGALDSSKTVTDYLQNTTNDHIKTSYWTSLARERYNQSKLLEISN